MTASRYILYLVLPLLRMMSCFHTIEPVGGQACCVICHVAVPVDMVWAAAAHWLGGQDCWGTLAGLSMPIAVLGVWRLNSAAAGGCGVHFAVCFMLVVSCTLTAKSAIYNSHAGAGTVIFLFFRDMDMTLYTLQLVFIHHRIQAVHVTVVLVPTGKVLSPRLHLTDVTNRVLPVLIFTNLIPPQAMEDFFLASLISLF